jgi:hypothetical protein
LKLIALAFACLAPIAGRAAAIQVANLRDPVVLQDDTGSLRPGRGTNVGFPLVVTVGRGGFVVLEGDDGSLLSVLGPALFRLEEGFVELEYGSYFLKGLLPGASSHRVLGRRFGDAGEETYVVIGPSRENAQIWTSFESLDIDDETLDPGEVGMIALRRIEKAAAPKEDVQALRQRHAIATSVPSRSEDERTRPPVLRDTLDFGAQTGFNMLSPRASSTLESGGTAFGVLAEYVHRRYFRLPQRAARLHFIRAPNLRLGAGASLDWTRIQPQPNYQPFTRISNLYGLIGLSWLGLSADFLAGSRAATSDHLKLVSPYNWGVRASYVFDLLPWTLADIELRVGALYTGSDLKLKSEDSLPDVNPRKFNWKYLALQGAFSFRF